MKPPGEAPRGVTLLLLFWFFGAAMAFLAGITLLWRGTFLDHAWALNPTAHKELSAVGPAIGVLFLLLGVALAATGVGWLKRRRWGWILAAVIVFTQMAGDLVNLLRGDFLRGCIGLAIASALFLYLLRPAVRSAFAPRHAPQAS